MIPFRCPACATPLTAAQAGARVACPKCGQKILVPLPNAGNKTTLAKPMKEEKLPVVVEVGDQREEWPQVLAAEDAGSARPRPKRLLSGGMLILVIVAVVLAVFVPVGAIFVWSLLRGVSSKNARCISCFREFSIPEGHRGDWDQQYRCPHCGDSNPAPVLYKGRR